MPTTSCSVRDCRRSPARRLCAVIVLAAALCALVGPAEAAAPVHLTVTKQGSGAGSITSDVGDIDCGAVCDADVPSGQPVTLTAVAAPGSTFTGWSGAACSGTVTTCTTAPGDDEVTAATFDLSAAPPGGSTPAPPVPTSPAPAPELQLVLTPLPHVAAAAHRAGSRPALRARPMLRGQPHVGRTLSCTRGSWAERPGRYGFVWSRDGKTAGTGASYRVRAADRGHALRCHVTAVNSVGTATAESAAVRIPLGRRGA